MPVVVQVSPAFFLVGQIFESIQCIGHDQAPLHSLPDAVFGPSYLVAHFDELRPVAAVAGSQKLFLAGLVGRQRGLEELALGWKLR